MNRRIRAIGIAAVATAALLSAPAGAYASTTFDTGMIVVGGTKAVGLGVGGSAVVSLNKVSDPGVQVRISTDAGPDSVTMVTHAAGENGCSAVDDLGAGTLNRTYVVHRGTSATVYVRTQYTVTTPAGVSTTTVLEPLGPVGLAAGPLALFHDVPVDVCVA